MEDKLYIIEERANLLWGTVIVVFTAAGAYLLRGAFLAHSWHLGLQQILTILFFIVAFIGILKISESAYRFTLHFESDLLIIQTQKGNYHVSLQKIDVHKIEALKFSPHYSRSSHEARFDFSTNYHLMFRTADEGDYQRMLNPDAEPITLKVHDIANIMRFIKRRNPDIFIPQAQASYFDL